MKDPTACARSDGSSTVRIDLTVLTTRRRADKKFEDGVEPSVTRGGEPGPRGERRERTATRPGSPPRRRGRPGVMLERPVSLQARASGGSDQGQPSSKT
jgi:hypothetical protein